MFLKKSILFFPLILNSFVFYHTYALTFYILYKIQISYRIDIEICTILKKKNIKENEIQNHSTTAFLIAN